MPCHHSASGDAYALELFFHAVYKHRRICDPHCPDRSGEAAIETPLLHLLGDSMPTLTYAVLNTSAAGFERIHAKEKQADPEARLSCRLHRAENFDAGKGRLTAKRLAVVRCSVSRPARASRVASGPGRAAAITSGLATSPKG